MKPNVNLKFVLSDIGLALVCGISILITPILFINLFPSIYIGDGWIIAFSITAFAVTIYLIYRAIFKLGNKEFLKRIFGTLLIVYGYELFTYSLCEYMFLDEFDEFNRPLFNTLNYGGFSLLVIGFGLKLLLGKSK